MRNDTFTIRLTFSSTVTISTISKTFYYYGTEV